MTIASDYAPDLYAGNDLTYSFAFTFPVLAKTDLVVTRIDDAGVETVQVENTNYRVSNWRRPGDTGTVSMGYYVGPTWTNLPIPTGEQLRIERVMAYTQPTDLVNSQRYLAESVERGLDRLEMQIQQVKNLTVESATDHGVLAGLGGDDHPQYAKKANLPINVNDYGAVGNGTTDDTTAIQAAIDALPDGGVVAFSPGFVYATSAPLILGTKRSISAIGATIQALPSFTGPALLILKEGDGSNPAWHSSVTGGTWDSSFLCDGIEVYSGRECLFDRLFVLRSSQYGMHAGSSPSATSTGLNVRSSEFWWHEDYSAVAGHLVNPSNSVGVFHDNVTDSYVSQTYAVGYRIGFSSSGDSNSYMQCHAWGRRAHGPLSACFAVSGGGCKFTDCYADTPHNWYWNGSAYAQDGAITEVYGFYINGFSQFVFNSMVFINANGGNSFGATDNLVVGIGMGPSLPSGGYGAIQQFAFAGGSASYRYKSPWAGVIANCTILGLNIPDISNFASSSDLGNNLGFLPTKIAASPTIQCSNPLLNIDATATDQETGFTFQKLGKNIIKMRCRANDGAFEMVAHDSNGTATDVIMQWWANAGYSANMFRPFGTLSGRYVKTNLVNSTNGSLTLGGTYDFIDVLGTNGHTLVLPACESGRRMSIKNSATGVVTINRAGSNTIDGGTSIALYSKQSVVLIGNANGDWSVFGMHVWSAVPSTAASTGAVGQMAYDATYLYICTATNTWRRILHATW